MGKNTKKSPQSSSKKRYLVFGIVAIIVILLGLGGWKVCENLQSQSYPLGDGLHYIGKKDYGAPWVGPYSVYYYTTDMEPAQLKTYFKNATYKDNPNHEGGSSATYNFEDLSFNSPTGSFTFNLYSNNTAAKDIPQKDPLKKYVLSITDSGYKYAQKAL